MDAQSTFDTIRTKALYNLNDADSYARQFFTTDGVDRWVVAANPTNWNL